MPKTRTLKLPPTLLLFLLPLLSHSISLPPTYDGFVYRDVLPRDDSVVVEAFLDPICPDSRDSWPPLKSAFENYYPRVFLLVHPFPLPYHDNSFVSCRALHISNQLNASSTYPLLELLFKHQEEFYNNPTKTMSRESIVSNMSKLAASIVGNNLSAFEDGFKNSKTDHAARTSFKYGCSRGVFGTPYFFVNGFPLPGAGSALNYTQWTNIIDQLLSEQRETGDTGRNDA